MKKQHLFIISAVISLGLVFGIYQYFQAFKITNVSAVAIGTPNPGHKWDAMECSSDTLCIDEVNKRLGIGTNSPTQKLEINGSILASGTGDVCNGAGKCLSSIFQTNVIAGSNPVCPTGQTIIMKAYNGTWYTSDNTSITTWNKVSCGAQMTADGTPLLVNNLHTQGDCVAAGGTVVATDVTANQCKFSGGSCGGWTRYQSYGRLGGNTCVEEGCYHNSRCTNGIGAWGNPGSDPGSCYYGNGSTDGYQCYMWGALCAPTLLEIGCY